MRIAPLLWHGFRRILPVATIPQESTSCLFSHTSARRGGAPPPAIVFPPRPRESGAAVVGRIFAAYGLYDDGRDETLFDTECLQFVQDLMTSAKDNDDES